MAPRSPGTDYLLNPLEGDIEFGNLTSKQITIPLLNTTAADGPRTILVELSNPLPAGLASLGARVLAILTINDDEPTLRLNSAAYVVGEASTSFNVTVLRSGPATAAVSVSLVPTAGTATGGTCGTRRCGLRRQRDPGDAQRQPDRRRPSPCQSARTHSRRAWRASVSQLQSPVGATLATPKTATVSVTDNEVGGTLQWSVADASGVEGTTLLLTVTRTGGTASDVTVEVQAHDGDADTPGDDAVAGVDYEIVTATPLTFGAGILSQTVEISLLARDGSQAPRALPRDPPRRGGRRRARESRRTVTVWILDPS